MTDANDASLCFYSDSCRLHLSILVSPYKGSLATTMAPSAGLTFECLLFNQNEYLTFQAVTAASKTSQVHFLTTELQKNVQLYHACTMVSLY